MTPKNKAGLLIATFRKTLFENGNPNNVNDHSGACAIACVEEIIEQLKYVSANFTAIDYWNKVLEILKSKQ